MEYKFRRGSSQRVVTFVCAMVALGTLGSTQMKRAPWRSISVNPERRLSDYATYRWDPDLSPAEKPNHEVITRAVERRLEDRGYELDEAHPDVYVSYSLELQEEELRRPSEYEDRRHEPGFDEPWDLLIWSAIDIMKEDLDPNEVKIRQLLMRVDFEEAETGVFLWGAEGTYPWVPELTEKSVDVAISDLVAPLPSVEKSKTRNPRNE